MKIPGLQYDLPNSLVLSAKTITILYFLQQKGRVALELDDSPEDAAVASELRGLDVDEIELLHTHGGRRLFLLDLALTPWIP